MASAGTTCWLHAGWKEGSTDFVSLETCCPSSLRASPFKSLANLVSEPRKVGSPGGAAERLKKTVPTMTLPLNIRPCGMRTWRRPGGGLKLRHVAETTKQASKPLRTYTVVARILV